MDILMIFLTVIIGAIYIYSFSIRNYDFFKKRGIPFIKPTPFLGNMTEVLLKKKSMPGLVNELYDLHPDAKYVGFYDCSVPIILLRDPELVKSVTIKNFDSFPNHKMFAESPTESLFQKNLFALKDDEWRDMRTLLSPAFTSSKIKSMFKILSKCAVDFSDHLAKQNPQPENLDIKNTFGRYTVDVIASAAFGLSINSMKDRDNEFYRMGKEVFRFSGFKMVKFFIIKSLPWIAKLLNMRILDSKTSSFFKNVIETTIATRDEQGIVRPDILQLMMQARDRKGKSELSSEIMTAQAFVFFIGGYESPSSTMSYAAHALAVNPDLQRRLQAEIDEVLQKNSGQVSFEDLHAMKYLDAVVNETLRICSPIAFTDRVGVTSFILPPALPGLEPFEIKPGQSIWIPIYSFHHDPKYFPEPEKFDPERFSEENKSKIDPLTYFPFGIGPRICIANRFALIQIKLVLFHVLAKCNFLKSSKTVSSIKLRTDTLTPMPEGGFWLKIEPRK